MDFLYTQTAFISSRPSTIFGWLKKDVAADLAAYGPFPWRNFPVAWLHQTVEVCFKVS